MIYVRFPLSLRNVEDLLNERGIDVCHETIRFWWNRFGPFFAAEIRKDRINHTRSYSNWQWYLDEVFVKINCETHYLWRAVDHEGEVLESIVTKRRDRRAALKFLKKTMQWYGDPEVIVTDRLKSYGAAMKMIGNAQRPITGRRLNNRAESSHLPFDEESEQCCGSSGCIPCRSLLPSMLRSSTTSTMNVTSIHELLSNSNEPPLSPSGGSFVPHRFTHSVAN